MLHSDLLVIGAGIAGLTVARAARKHGISVTVVDAAKPGEGTSWMAAGMLAPLVEARLSERDLLTLGRASLARWETFSEEVASNTSLDIGYRTEGTILTGAEHDHFGMIDHTAEEYRSLGLEVEGLTGEDLRRYEPCLATGAMRGYFVPGDHQVDNRVLIRVLLDNLEESDGVDLLSGTRIVALEEDSSGITLVSENGPVASGDRVVVAVGAYLSRIKGLPNSVRRVVQPVKGEIVRLRQSSEPLLRHVVRTPEVYLVPKSDGTLVIGASTEERGFEAENRVGPTFELLRSAYETVPGVYELPMISLGVGFRPATLDHMPMVGRLGDSRIFLASGYYRHGILFAPYCADLLLRYIENDHEPEELRPFRPDRFDHHFAQR